jgi:YesN/AraC family two-component response regulator
MLEDVENQVRLKINPWPEFSTASYRYFLKNEKHITRICNHYVLIFMLENTLFFTENGIKIALKKNEWYVQKPGLLQKGTIGCPSPSYFYIHFYAEEVDLNNLKELNNVSYVSITLLKSGLFDIKSLKPLLEELDYCYKYRPHDILSLQSIFLSIINTITLSNTRKEGKDLAWLITQYITENYNKDISCKHIADKFHISTEYLNQKLKQSYGLTPGQYLRKIRMARANDLLSNTDHTLSFIASEIGYHDITVFYKAFKKQCSMSPGRWREISRGLHK